MQFLKNRQGVMNMIGELRIGSNVQNYVEANTKRCPFEI
jgi:hypothetical protein